MLETFYKGLCEEEIKQRIDAKEVNTFSSPSETSFIDIVKRHSFTYFNFLNLALALAISLDGKWQNLLFLLTVFLNTLISIVQEFKANKQLKKLKLLNEEKLTVIRNGQKNKLPKQEIVKDEIFYIFPGQQVPCDATVLQGEVEINEALLTGEEDPVSKNVADILSAGCYCLSGEAILKATRVGENSSLNQMLAHLKKSRNRFSVLRDNLGYFVNKISHYLAFAFGLIFIKQLFITKLTFYHALALSAASLVGLIPQGLILLTSIALSSSALRLSKENILVQENYSLENLARCNVVCFDKTGTLTSNELIYKGCISYKNKDFKSLLSNHLRCQIGHNKSSKVVLEALEKEKYLPFTFLKAFSSTTKKSLSSYQNKIYQFGSYEFLTFNKDKESDAFIDKYLKLGYRVISFGDDEKLMGIVLLYDKLRPNVNETLTYLRKQGLDLYILSGDNPQTIQSLIQQIPYFAKEKAEDVSNLKDEEFANLNSHILGRITPLQKKLFIENKQKSGYTVAMIGDGVNDCIALHQADFAIALGNASESARNLANIILLDNDFKHFPSIINEGRRVINNIKRSATLFLNKTFLAFFLNIFTLIFLKTYPLLPIQFTLLALASIAIPSFALTLENNNAPLTKTFLSDAYQKALPTGLIAALVASLIIYLNNDKLVALISIFILFSYQYWQINKPFNSFRSLILILDIVAFFLPLIIKPQFFFLKTIELKTFLMAILMGIISIYLYLLLMYLNNKIRLLHKKDSQ